MNSNFIINLQTPVNNGDASNKSYVDGLVVTSGSGTTKSGNSISAVVDGTSLYINGSNQLSISSGALGSGLSGGSGSSISVNSSQPGITSLGTLTSLIVSGSLTAQSGLSANGQKITSVANPTVSTDAVNLGYLDTLITNSAGSGLVASGQVLSVNVDNFSLYINGSNQLSIASTALSTGLSGGNGSPISVVSNQSQVTNVGVLTSLGVSGIVSFTNTTQSNSITTGAMLLSGGLGIAKNLYIGGVLYAMQGLSANSYAITNLATPTNSSDASNKSYVDGLVATSGNGTSKTLNAISAVVDNSSIYINGSNQISVASTAISTGLTGGNGSPISVISNQSQVTNVGLLTSLSVSGLVSISNTTQSTSVSTGSIVTYGGIGVADSMFIGKNVNILGTTDSTAIGFGTLIISGGVSIGMKLQVNGDINVNGNSILQVATPVNASDASNKNYVDGLVATAGNGTTKTGNAINVKVDNSSIEINGSNQIRVASGICGTGLSGGSGSAISVNSSQSQITTIGTLTSLTVTGSVSFFSSLNMNSNKITSLASPTVSSDVVNLSYLNSTINSAAGTGLSANSQVLSVNSSQVQINVIGTLNYLKVGSNFSGTPSATGSIFNVIPLTFTDSNTVVNGTCSMMNFNSIDACTLNSLNTGITTTNATTLYISGAPIAGINETITNSYALWISSGKVRFDGDVTISGSLSSNTYTANITETYSIATNGGTFSSGSWQVRTLNTSDIDPGTGITLSSNQISIPAGTYIIEASAPGCNVGNHAIRLYNVTSSTVDAFGTSENSSNNDVVFISTRSSLKLKLVLNQTTVYELQHICQNTRIGDGLGSASGWQTEVYSTVFIQKFI
jgi:hypothetical protein